MRGPMHQFTITDNRTGVLVANLTVKNRRKDLMAAIGNILSRDNRDLNIFITRIRVKQPKRKKK